MSTTIADEAPAQPSRIERAMCRMADVSLDHDTDTPSWSIAEASERTGVSAHTLRYYERVGLIDDVPRASGGQRKYTTRSLGRIVFLSRMRSTGMSIDALRRYVGLIREGEHTSPQRRQLLEDHRREVIANIAVLHDALTILDIKIDDYRIWEHDQ